MFTTRAAVIGTGFIGPIHVEALRRAGVVVRGILGSSPEKSETAARELGIERAYGDLDELLADSQVGAVHITSPNRLHHEMVVRSLAAGKHVQCEKPLAMDPRESAELVKLAREARGRGLATGVTYNLRYYAINQEAAQRVGDGALGDIRFITGSYAQDWLFYDTDFNWRVLAEEGGALRAVADIGTHWLDMAQLVTGRKVESVCADLATVIPVRQRPKGGVDTFSGKLATGPTETEPVEISTEDYGSILLRFTGGVRGSFWVSQISAGQKNRIRWEVAGSKATMAWDSVSPNDLWMGYRDRSNELFMRDPALMGKVARASTSLPGGHDEGYGDTFKHLFRAFYSSIEAGVVQGAPSYPTFEDGHEEIVLCEAILRSQRERRWVDVDEVREV